MGTGGGADATGEPEDTQDLSALLKCEPVNQKWNFLEGIGSVTSPFASQQQSNTVAVRQCKDALQLQSQISLILLFIMKFYGKIRLSANL